MAVYLPYLTFTPQPEPMMPIVHFVSVRERDRVPADAQNVRLTTSYRNSVSQEKLVEYGIIPAVVPDDVPAGEHPGDLILWDSHVGLCIEDRERNMYHDSDFYMTVWNPEKGEPETIEFASTRGWSYPSYGSKADATPEVIAAYRAWEKARNERMEREHNEWLATQPTIGRRVRVVRGRKLPKGTLAEVKWESAMPNRFARPGDRRIGIKPDGHTERGYIFVGADQVEVVA